MSKIADDIRGLRDSVVGQFSWDMCVTESKPKKKKVNRFSNWMEEVEEAVSEICGMDIDILDGTNWGNLYNAGSSPDQAAKLALEYAEDDDKEDVDDDLLSVRRDDTVSIKRKRYTEGKHVSLRRRGFSLSNRLHKFRNSAGDDDSNKASDFVNENVMKPVVKSDGKDDMFNYVMDILNNMSEPLDAIPAKKVINEQVAKEIKPKKTSAVVSDMEMMMAAQQSVSDTIVQERVDRANFVNSQMLQQRQDEDTRVYLEEKGTIEKPIESVTESVSEDVKEPIVAENKASKKKKSSKKKAKTK